MKRVNEHATWLLVLIVSLALYGCGSHNKVRKHSTQRAYLKGTQRPYNINGRTYYPLPSAVGYSETGLASWYGPKFHGRQTANGERYNMHAMTAAHKTLPMNTLVKVENLENGKSVVVRINDRGPFVKNRVIDLSRSAAARLGMLKRGVAKVRLTALGEVASLSHGKPRFSHVPDFEHGDFYIQIGSFKRRQNALRLQARLAKKYPKVVVLRHITRLGAMYRVQIFASNRLSHAREMVWQMEQRGFPGAFLVSR